MTETASPYTRWYLYDKLTKIYIGMVEHDVQPDCSTEYCPPDEMGGFVNGVSRFDGLGWNVIPDLSKLTIRELYDYAFSLILNAGVQYASEEKYPLIEMDTFDEQYTDARDVKLGGEPTPLLAALAEVHKCTPEELADKIIAKREAVAASKLMYLTKVVAERKRIESITTRNELTTEIFRLLQEQDAGDN